jgi:hypothetical protein
MYPPSESTTPPAAVPRGALPLVAALCAVALGWLGPLAYPFRLLSTTIHELSHGLAALLTGGAFLRFVVFPDGSGLAYTAGGIRWLIIPAGYVGTALVGAALIALGGSPQRSRVALGALGAALALLTLRYGLPSVLSAEILGGLLTVAAGVGAGMVLLLAAWRVGARWSAWLLNLVAFWVGLSALSDLRSLVTATAAMGIGTVGDAHAMARLTLLPPVFWASVWALIAAAALGTALWRTWLRPRRAP